MANNNTTPRLAGYLRLVAFLLFGIMLPQATRAQEEDRLAQLQAQAVASNAAPWGHWGPNSEKYSSWTTHSNRLIPVYSFGLDLDLVSGTNSVYRSAASLEKLYGYLPEQTVNPAADYFDQTDVYRLQQQAAASGKKRIILFVFDGMDWQTTRAAAIAKAGQVAYQSGRGSGLAFQDYRGTETDFGYFVTSPHNDGTTFNVDDQRVNTPGGKLRGGYDPTRGGNAPWAPVTDIGYLIAKGDAGVQHAYTDSASSATSLCSGIKTYNDAINVDFAGHEVEPIARQLQEQGFAIGVVTSVPISHATPAAAYANNVSRDDFQDLTRDLLGIPSVFHPGGLPGVDVLIGAGWGQSADTDGGQGKNFVAGNRYISSADLERIDIHQGGRYVVAQRTAGRAGIDVLKEGVKQAIEGKHRLFGYFGVGLGHLPFQTADGGYNPVQSVGNPKSAQAEVYSREDIVENVKLGDMAIAAADVLSAKSDRWWLMVEAGDVDWANHSNNIDNSIGALLSGDEAFARMAAWIETHGGWSDTAVILTADHGHYLWLNQPEVLAASAPEPAR
jgi:alkaline phosphatase